MQRLAFLAWACFSASQLFAAEPAQTAAKPTGSKPVVVEITPRAIESPILKYRFLPREDELKPGNAAPILLRLTWEQKPWMEKIYPNLHQWEDVPLTDPKWKEYGDITSQFFEDVRRASYRREASWEYPIGEAPAMTIRIPDVQGLRTILGYGLSSRAKFNLSRGEWEEALEVIKVGMSNGRHVASTPFVINQMVAAVIQRSMLDRTVDLVSQPKCPNLYWGLSVIPKGILSLERTADFESQMLVLTFPALQDLDKPRTKDEWKKLFDQILTRLTQILGLSIPKNEGEKREVLVRLEKVARGELPKLLGYSAGKVAQMTREEAILRWFVSRHQQLDNRYNAYMVLPPREALHPLLQLNRDTEEFFEHLNAKFFEHFRNPLFKYLTLHANYRKIQMLRIIEAVRHYAATHDGKFPDKLEDISDIPVPLDPLTDKPFVWKVEAGQAILSPPDLPPEITATIREKTNNQLSDLLGTTYHLKLRTK